MAEDWKSLDAIADALANPTVSTVDKWLEASTKSKVPTKTKLPSEYLNPTSRSGRLGLGAKPQSKPDSQSIFANYQLKNQLTGREVSGQGKKPLVAMIKSSSVTKPQASVKNRMKRTDEEEESKAKMVASAKPNLLGQYQLNTGKKKKR